MSCRLDTLADTTFSCVCDMTKDMSPTCRRDTRHVFKRRLGKTFQKKTFPAKVTVVKDKKKKSSGGSKCKCGCGGSAPTDGYTLLCAQRLGVPHDPHGIIKKKTERRLIKRALMAEERLAAAGLSVNEDEHGDDLIQALVIVITGKMVTAFPEVYKSLLHHMPTLFENKTPTLHEANPVHY